MHRLCPGKVVDLETPDPRGQNRKRRPVVVVSVNDSLGEFVFVAISTKLRDPLPDGWIPLPWSHDGKARSGLVEPCIAKTEWIGVAKQEEVAGIRGHLSTDDMLKIMRAVKKS